MNDILVVDDDSAMVEFLIEALLEQGLPLLRDL
jgi:hypothetical protein